MFADSVSEVPPVFTHMLENLPAVFETVIFVTVRCVCPHSTTIEVSVKRTCFMCGP